VIPATRIPRIISRHQMVRITSTSTIPTTTPAVHIMVDSMAADIMAVDLTAAAAVSGIIIDLNMNRLLDSTLACPTVAGFLSSGRQIKP
jgi:hypothetical protein